MSNSVKLINNNITTSTGLYLLNGEVTYNWKNNITADPIEGGYGNTEVVSNGWENPTFNLTFHLPINSSYVDGSTYMSWAKWNELSKNLYDSTDTDTQTKLQIKVGDSDTLLADYSASTSSTGVTDIPVAIKGYSLRFAPEDSRNAGHWVINAQLQVTK